MQLFLSRLQILLGTLQLRTVAVYSGKCTSTAQTGSVQGSSQHYSYWFMEVLSSDAILLDVPSLL